MLSGRGMIFIGGDNLHIISVLVNNHPGVLSRVVGLFSRRGYNIESLAVGTTEREDISRITLTVEGDDYTVTQVIRQLNKLVDVLTVQNIGARDNVSRELLLVKVGYDSNTRDDIMHIVDTFRAKVIDISMDSLIIELTGDNEKINAFINLINKFDVKELVRTGLVSLERGNKTLKEYEGEL
ncbi:acetolactate synthase, small subunit [Thermoanaerobacter uzonensis DSM 18761]|uniref:Acetolactate synthase small subunit n=1 Tax=Thermoanaerobacter uzonensis DSM 18761 TaxID=1123369 RepID=A0A1M4YFP7_9THEO|nr:acetolactate synthase, small subunit [Thermoanaerobacter uzonensis DSM 18761]